MFHSQIRTPRNSNNDKDLSTWIEKQPCMQMNFLQFSRNADIYIIPEKLSKIDRFDTLKDLSTWIG